MRLTPMLAVIALSGAYPAVAQNASPSAAPDYRADAAWLCRPGRSDACSANQDITVIAPNGSHSIEHFKAAAHPGFDCFYVYPTVSHDPSPNSDMTPGPEERLVAVSQAARFTSQCRVFAPLYRQVTLTALQQLMMGRKSAVDRAMALADVTAAWKDYLARDNHGRGVVLIGHSQGSGILKAMIAQSIEGTPAQSRIIAAYLPGTNLAVPAGKDVGGDLKVFPLCRRDWQYGCVVSYVTFRADAPPPANTRFGTVPEPGMVVACVNAAALTGGKSVTDAILGATGAGEGAKRMGPWTTDNAPVTTPFVKVPGLISAECVQRSGANYLAVTVNADLKDMRTDTIVGDVVVGGHILPEWGLHLLDMPVEMGNLVTLSSRQASAWKVSHH
uniref:DUF3089 domain-containing protein n=1 Tax=Sphingomonas sp. TaxID=28214 RepID=UPI00344C82FF